MPAYLEDTIRDTSSIVYSDTGMRLFKFVMIAYGLDVMDKLKTGDLILFFNGKFIRYNKNFRNYRVQDDSTVIVKRDTTTDAIFDYNDLFVTEGNHPFFF